MEILTILLIFSLGVIMLGCCFIGGIMFCWKLLKKLGKMIFGGDEK